MLPYTLFGVPRRASRRPHSGVTLLEVMIAVGVLAIGLLGLASLLPLGQNDMAVANRADRTASLGRSAFRDMLTRGYLRPDQWLYPQGGGSLRGTPVIANITNSSMITCQYTKPAGVNMPSVPPFCPIIIDPLFIAFNPNNISQIAGVPYISGNTIASSVSPVPQLPRASLRSAMPSAPGLRLTSASNALFTCLTQGLAERMFRGNDDCSFEPLADKSYRPVPIWATINSGLAAPWAAGSTNVASYAALQSKGDFSWMCMVEPDIGESVGGATYLGGVYGGDPSTTRFFKVTVIVFYKRPLFDITTISATDPPPERPVNVLFPYGGNTMTGNTVEAFLDIPSQDPTAAEQYLRVRPEQWIMVMAPGVPNYVAPDPNTGSLPANQTVAYWYRVVSPTTTVEQSPASGGYRRAVRLSGPDWPFPNQGAAGGPGGVGVIFEGAVGAYERVWCTDGTSFWSL